MQRRFPRPTKSSVESLESRLLLSAAVARVSEGLTHSQLLSLYASGKNEAAGLKSGVGGLTSVSTSLRNLYAAHPTGVGISSQEFGSIESSDGNPGVAVHTSGNVVTLLQNLEKLGLHVMAVNPATHMVDGYLPLSSMVLASKLSGVTSIAAINKAAVHSVGEAVDQGESVENVSNARSTFSVTGAGVKIGVISDSASQYDGGLSDSIGTGDLPGNVTILKDGEVGDTDEGRAMLEEIHDLAPGASLYFYSGDNAQDDMVSAINALKTAGCKIIVDDLGYNDEPMFQDGVISKAINTFVSAGGSYFSAIGNDGTSGYLHTNTTYNTTGGKTWVNWANNGASSGDTLSFTTNGPVDITLQWDNPYNGDTGSATADLDVFVYSGATLVTSSLDDNIASGIPAENLDTLPAGTYQMKVQVAALSAGAVAPDMIKFVAAEDADGGLTSVQYQNSTGLRSSAYGHGAGQNTISIGAVEFASAPPFSSVTPIHTEDYSSSGPIIYAFDVNGAKYSSPVTLDKPDVSGVDGINTSFFGDVMSDDPTNLPQFYGTSAAAPNVAAIAALIDQYKPGATQAQILAALKQSTVPLDGAASGAWDPQGGYGLVNASKALSYFGTVAVAPTVTLAAVTSPRTTAISSETITFSEAVSGFTLANLSLTKDGGSNLLTGAQTLTTTDQTTFTLTNLAGITAATGTYKLTLSPTGITGSGIALAAGTSVSWTNTGVAAPTVSLATVTTPRTTAVSSEVITFSQAVTGFSLANLSLTLNGGANLLTSAQSVSSNDQTNFLLNNLSSITAALGTYTLTLSPTGITGGGVALASGATISWQTTGSSAAPTVALSPITTPRTTVVDSETITFNEPVTGLSVSNFTLSRTLGANLINASAQTLTTTDNEHYTLGNLGALTSVSGSYVLTLSPSGVTGTGGALANGAAISWQMTTTVPVPPTATLATITPPANSETITFNEPVAGFSLSNLSLKLNGGSNLLTSAQTLTSTNQIVFTLSNLGAITTAAGTYTLTLSPSGITATGSNAAMTSGASTSFTVAAAGTAPTVSLATIASPTTTAISSEKITFNEAITGFTLSNLTLTRSGGSNLLTSSQTLTTSDQTVFTLNNLASLTSTPGTYVLTLSKTGITGSGIALASGASVTWTVTAAGTAPTVSLAAITSPTVTAVSSEKITFNEAVTGFTLANLTLTRNGGSNLLTSSQTVTTSDQTVFALNNMASLTGTPGTYVLTLSKTGITGGGIALASGASVTWVNNSGTAVTPKVSIGNASITKPASGTKPMTFTVTLSAAATSAVTIKYATVAGTASAGAGDYVGIPSGTLTIPAGQTTGTITVTINGNTAKNAARTFTVHLSSATNATLSTVDGTGTILSSSVATKPTVTFPATTSFVASKTATTTLSIAVTLSAAAASDVTITYGTVAGTASAGAGDYVGIPSGTLTILAGQTTGHITVSIKPHASTASKYFSVTLTGATNATLVNKTDKVTLT